MRLMILLFLFALLLAPRGAEAKLCGDNVGGRDVPCDCGDTVVSDVALGNDPVTQQVCARDGLIVRATGAAQAVTIDLEGKTLRGSGKGAGVWLVYGGPGGARVISSVGTATLEGFRDGVVARGPNAVALVDNLKVVGSKRDGIRVQAPGYTVRSTVVQEAGQDGFWLRGSDFLVTATQAKSSGRFGYFVMGSAGALGAVQAVDSKMAGINLLGMGTEVQQCEVKLGHKEGLKLNGMHMTVVGCEASGNDGDGISGVGMGLTVTGNRARDNGGNGIMVMGMDVVDGGGNAGSGNRGEGTQRAAVQCALGGVPCRR